MWDINVKEKKKLYTICGCCTYVFTITLIHTYVYRLHIKCSAIFCYVADKNVGGSLWHDDYYMFSCKVLCVFLLTTISLLHGFILFCCFSFFFCELSTLYYRLHSLATDLSLCKSNNNNVCIIPIFI